VFFIGLNGKYQTQPRKQKKSCSKHNEFQWSAHEGGASILATNPNIKCDILGHGGT
jgi:hypothetical protein